MTPTPNSPVKVVLDRITEVERTDTGRAYFAAYFRAGLFGRPVRRAFFGTPQDNGTVTWERVSPEALKPLVGQDLSSEVHIEPVHVEPLEYIDKNTGEARTVTTATVVRLTDETTEAAARIYGYHLRTEKAEVQPIAPPGFHVVPGDGA